MVVHNTNGSDKATNGRIENGSSSDAMLAKATPAQKTKENLGTNKVADSAELKDYQLGECLGKGAFGSVYKALNWGTGETVAVKQIKLADLPKSDLRVIMLEIDLLKNLNHPNIVKYHGSVKSTESLSIILEYCENGSLHSICKNFGKFPENLVALYMSQTLHGLLYLHEQGVIHRDIKGANILTTKEGLVKLADFGVATKAAGLHESSVVGTPYWMAPEVIELSGATTASDIWSLGCTVIELLDGKPPYHKLQPMPALFRIVNDEHPPLPESASPTVQDFLMQCFQKDPNLRVSAKKLLKHPWIVNARRAGAVVQAEPTKYDQAVKTVQLWNEALKSPDNGTLRRNSREESLSPAPSRNESRMSVPIQHGTQVLDSKTRPNPDLYRSPVDAEQENWDDDFEASSGPNGLKLPEHLRPVDHFSGMLSSEKLKQYATTGSGTSEEDKGVLSTGKPASDPLETVRPPSPSKTRQTRPKEERIPQLGRGGKVTQRLPSQPNTQILRPPQNPNREAKRTLPPKRSSSVFREDSVEDYSDLIAEDDVAFDQKVDEIRKSVSNAALSPTFPHVSDLKAVSRSKKNIKISNNVSNEHTSLVDDQEPAIKRIQSSLEIQKYAEKTEDEDFSDIFDVDETVLAPQESESGSDRDPQSMLISKLSSFSWFGDDDADDPFAQLEENLDEMDLETKVARDRHVRLCTLVEGLVGSLKTAQSDDYLADLSDQLLQVLLESPDMKSVVISAHGLLPILEVLESCQRRDISLRLLKIINTIIQGSVEIQETLCFVGGIPIITKFAHKKYSSDIRLEAAAFVRQMYQSSTLTLQMFISCGGLNVLVEFLEEDYEVERDLVIIGVNGVWSVFELQGPTPKNDFCRIFSRSSALYPLSLILTRVLDEQGELAELVQGRIVNIFLLFSQAENHVKESVSDPKILKRVLKDIRRMSPNHQITMLKFIKNLSMLATTLDALQNSMAIEVLAELLSSSVKLRHGVEVSNQIANIMFNLCRLSKPRQEDAALNGVIPLLQRIAESDKPVKNFALPILCDMAHSGKVCRAILWQNKGLHFYINLVDDLYWGGTALDAIFIWLQEETAKVEEHLLESSFSKAILNCFADNDKRAMAFENALEPLQKLLRLSPPVAATLAHPQFFALTSRKLKTNHRKAVVRGNLLRIIRSICDASEEQCGLIRRYGLYEAIESLADHDPAILVRNMASDLIRLSDISVRASIDGHMYHPFRRPSSSTMTPPSLYSSSSLPPTPQQSRGGAQPAGYFEMGLEYNNQYNSPRSRTSNINGSTPYRPISREGSKLASESSSTPSSGGVAAGLGASGGGVSGKSKLPRINPPPSNSGNAALKSPSDPNKTRANASRLSRPSVQPKKDENMPPPHTPASQLHGALPRSNVVVNPRRRRQTGGTG